MLALPWNSGHVNSELALIPETSRLGSLSPVRLLAVQVKRGDAAMCQPAHSAVHQIHGSTPLLKTRHASGLSAIIENLFDPTWLSSKYYLIPLETKLDPAQPSFKKLIPLETKLDAAQPSSKKLLDPARNDLIPHSHHQKNCLIPARN